MEFEVSMRQTIEGMKKNTSNDILFGGMVNEGMYSAGVA